MKKSKLASTKTDSQSSEYLKPAITAIYKIRDGQKLTNIEIEWVIELIKAVKIVAKNYSNKYEYIWNKEWAVLEIIVGVEIDPWLHEIERR